MRITLEVGGGGGAADRDGSAGDGGTAGAGALDLREWLRAEPELRGLVGRVPVPPPGRDAMGALGELVPLLLQPGGLTVTLAASVVAWLQTRRGSQTVTITRPDGTQVVVTSEGVRGLTPEASGDLAQQVARALQDGNPPGGNPGDGSGSGGGSGSGSGEGS
ncbi:effector-associated constant component EACC1 [Streptomyces cinereoruber]|uniref:effector-associated constant component EACC1 n=1 Tax=Streptomyces cinereoruber TaxID=67260 RepID=UPI003C2BDE29